MAGIQSAIANYNSQKAQYYTEIFQMDVDKINVNNSATKSHNAAANKCGFYFEHEVYRYLSLLASDKEPNDYSDDQRNAEKYFSSGDPTIIEYGKIISQAAAQVAENLVKEIEKESEKLEWEVNVIADITGTTKKGYTYTYGNPAGDLQLIVNGKSIVLELKWQENSDKMISYFHSVSEATLFKGAFKEYLTKNFSRFWNHEFRELEWKTQIGTVALPEFLLDTYGDWKSAIEFLLAKGHAHEGQTDKSGNIVGKISQDEKLVIHGTSASIEIANIQTLAAAFDRKDIAVKNRNTKITQKTGSRGIKWMVSDNELANFGIRSFYGAGMKDTFEAKRAATREKRAAVGIEKAKFSYNMYINSKLFDQNWLSTLI